MSATPVRLFHITSHAEWQVAQAFSQYRPRRFAEEGFIHCSYAHQVKGVADRLFPGASDLVLLEIDPSRLSCRIVDENLEGGAQLFPHIYGPLPLHAVSAVHAFPCEADGTFACRMI
jgi:uncharacterized protein (DUF952 family)